MSNGDLNWIANFIWGIADDVLRDLLKAALDGYQVYAQAQIDQLVGLYLSGADRDKLDPILDDCVAVYKEQLDEDGQVDFKGKAKGFLRAYGFLSSILPYTNAGWERLSIFLNFLIPKLPAPKEEDLSKGILEAIDMDGYRVEKKAAMKIQLPDENAEIDPVPMTAGGSKSEPEEDSPHECAWSPADVSSSILPASRRHVYRWSGCRPSMLRWMVMVMGAGIICVGWGLLSLFALGFQRHEAGGIAVLIRQLHKNDDHGTWGQRKGAGAPENIAPYRVQVHLRLR